MLSTWKEYHSFVSKKQILLQLCLWHPSVTSNLLPHLCHAHYWIVIATPLANSTSPLSVSSTSSHCRVLVKTQVPSCMSPHKALLCFLFQSNKSPSPGWSSRPLLPSHLCPCSGFSHAESLLVSGFNGSIPFSQPLLVPAIVWNTLLLS